MPTEHKAGYVSSAMGALGVEGHGVMPGPPRDLLSFIRPPRQGLGIRLTQNSLLHEELQSASHRIAGLSVGVVEGAFLESARFLISAVGSTVPFSYRVDH